MKYYSNAYIQFYCLGLTQYGVERKGRIYMKRFYTIFLVVIVFSCWTTDASAQNVTFTDASLAAVVRKALGLSEGVNIPQAELRKLRRLDAVVRNPNSGIIYVSGFITGSPRPIVSQHPMQLAPITDLTGLEQATALEFLWLRFHQISDITPLAGLTQLEALLLPGCPITDVSALTNLTRLTHLTIGGDQIRDLSVLANLTQLVDLTIGGNQISDSDLSVLANLTQLHTLFLRGSQISDIRVLTNLTQLRHLSIEQSAVRDISVLANLTQLGVLWLGENSISDISVLARLTLLRWIDLGFNQISDISALAGLTNLTTLRLVYNQISDITPLAGLTQLITLELEGNPISDTTPIVLLTNLEHLDIDADLNLNRDAPRILKMSIEGGNLSDIPVGHSIDVVVIFEADGTRYIGNLPNNLPYILVYLGTPTPENERRAVWHSAEDANSTKVTFRYTVQFGDATSNISIKPNSLTVPPGAAITDDEGNIFFTPVGGEGRTFPTPAILQQTVSLRKLRPSPVAQDRVIFNELRNAFDDTHDWIELKNISEEDVSLTDWEISLVTPTEVRMYSKPEDAGQDVDLVAFPDYTLPAGGILVITNTPPSETYLTHGQDITDPESDPDGLPQYLVAPEMILPNTPYLLILRSAGDKNGKPEAFEDVLGTYFRNTLAYQTQVWPLQETLKSLDALIAPLTVEKAYQRIDRKKRGYLAAAWEASGHQSGLGYKPKAPLETSLGSPGYPNDPVMDENLVGRVTFSELMFTTNGGLFSLPQWIELYNNTPFAALPINLKGWKLVVETREPDGRHRHSVIELEALEIAPARTVLLVTRSRRHSEQLSADQIYHLSRHHSGTPRLGLRENAVLSTEGFALKLIAPNGMLVDSVGTLDGERGRDDPMWALPSGWTEDGARTSLIRRYTDDVGLSGTESTSWVRAADLVLPVNTYYGAASDLGTPGYREGGAAPVELSHFSASWTDGGVMLEWETESELSNAGFHVLRSETKTGGFVKVNPSLIPGAGTSAERHTYIWIDTPPSPNVVYYYRIADVSLSGIQRELGTVRLRGHISAGGKLLRPWGDLKTQD